MSNADNDRLIEQTIRVEQTIRRLKNIDATMDLIIEYLRGGGADDIRAFNTWLGEQAKKAKDTSEEPPHE